MGDPKRNVFFPGFCLGNFPCSRHCFQKIFFRGGGSVNNSTLEINQPAGRISDAPVPSCRPRSFSAFYSLPFRFSFLAVNARYIVRRESPSPIKPNTDHVRLLWGNYRGFK
jgi:hypothetical protein